MPIPQPMLLSGMYKFSCVSARNIYLKFEEIGLQNINISDDLQAVIAPAILPRSFKSGILQFIRTFKAQVPVTSPERQSVGGLYYLSYLDKNDILLGSCWRWWSICILGDVSLNTNSSICEHVVL
ncbi:putative plastid-lipid-associated protein 10, chloroplastic [Datura stramonium]|uniref:Plastid-lipid-associated protein 10, chloroplastic n=1 Tax=Datura stramonium TaxID=4076 RepID=A0ABS8TF84_DATST|nr:putative plastid-lipid-associated protein 10, chloroplastic [Datura stramonium]